MAETQRERVPLIDDGELDTALAYLGFARHCVLKKTEGLTEEQLRQRLVQTETNLIGLVQHLTGGERVWFRHMVGGGPDIEEDELGMIVPADRTAAEVIADYRAAIEDSDAVIQRVGDMNAPMAGEIEGVHYSMRWVIAHMTSETARHAGHADILREQIDGTTGR